MAYKNLVSQACVDKNEAFCRYRDYICKRNGTYDYSTTGIGWTLHDSSYATDEDNCAINDWYVIYSAGENGNEDIYLKVTWTNAGLKIHGYLSWDASTHAGSARYCGYGTYNMYFLEAAVPNIWIYGDLDHLTLINKRGTGDYASVMVGKLDAPYEDLPGDIVTCSHAIASGSDISITVSAAPANWKVGKDLFIRTTHNNAMGTTEIEKITIKTIAGNVITADMDEAFTTGAKLSDFVGYGVNNQANFYAGYNALINPNGAYNGKHTYTNLNLSTTSFDPEDYDGRWLMQELFWQGATGFFGKWPQMLKVPAFTTGLTYEDVMDDQNGGEWRAFKMYSNFYMAIWEV